jgi:hypothetical protein
LAGRVGGQAVDTRDARTTRRGVHVPARAGILGTFSLGR